MRRIGVSTIQIRNPGFIKPCVETGVDEAKGVTGGLMVLRGLRSQGLPSLCWVQGCSAGSPVVPIFPPHTLSGLQISLPNGNEREDPGRHVTQASMSVCRPGESRTKSPASLGNRVFSCLIEKYEVGLLVLEKTWN